MLDDNIVQVPFSSAALLLGKTTRSKIRNSFSAGFLFGDLMILIIISVRRDLHEALAECGIKVVKGVTLNTLSAYSRRTARI